MSGRCSGDGAAEGAGRAPRWGVLVVAHGSHDPRWPDLVRSSVPVAALPWPAALGFLEEVPEQTLARAVAELEAYGCTHVVAVPLFACSDSVDLAKVRYALGVQAEPPPGEPGPGPLRTRCRIVLSSAFDDHPAVARVLADRALALSQDPTREAVVLVGHGSERPQVAQAWAANLASLSRQVAALGGFRWAAGALLHPDTVAATVQAAAREGRVLVVPVMLARGYFTGQLRRRLKGLPCHYREEGLLPHPGILEWVRQQADRWMLAPEAKPA